MPAAEIFFPLAADLPLSSPVKSMTAGFEAVRPSSVLVLELAADCFPLGNSMAISFSACKAYLIEKLKREALAFLSTGRHDMPLVQGTDCGSSLQKE